MKTKNNSTQSSYCLTPDEKLSGKHKHNQWKNRTEHRMLALALLVLTGLFSAGSARAQSCSTYTSSIVSKFGTIPANSIGTMQARLATNRSDGAYVSYGELSDTSGAQGLLGPLVYHPASGIVGIDYVPPYLEGEVAQFFSDRRYTTGKGLQLFSDPFDPSKTDNLGITVWLGAETFGFPPVTLHHPGDVTFTLNSWGKGTVPFPGLCQDGMIYGFNGPTMMVLSLFDLQIFTNPPPPK